MSDDIPFMVSCPSRQRMIQRHSPVSQEEHRSRRDAVQVEKRFEHFIDAPGTAGDIDHRVVLSAASPQMQSPIQGADAWKGHAAVRLGKKKVPHHFYFVDDAGVHNGVVNVADHCIPGTLGGDEDVGFDSLCLKGWGSVAQFECRPVPKVVTGRRVPEREAQEKEAKPIGLRHLPRTGKTGPYCSITQSAPPYPAPDDSQLNE
ncbi:MAG: hypothetical protein ACD_75C01352G0001 [uncultured bacterium]|nr:MAG: hypothetical protein ACD_75C01352G0001 [uncultured bacterium]